MDAKRKSPRSRFIMRAIKGVVIGIAAILPGASGGVLAVSIGLYRPAIEAIYGVFRHFKRSVAFLLPIGLGAMAGILGTTRTVHWLILNYETPTMYALVGLVIGGVPSFIREANARGFKKRYLLSALAGFAIIAALALVERSFSDGEAWSWHFGTAVVTGVILAIGTIIPGISTSFLLMYIGLFEPALYAINHFDIPMMIGIFIGAASMAVLLVLFVKRMFDRHYGYAYYGAFGMLIATTIMIFPGLQWSLMQLLHLGLLAVGFLISYFLCRLPDGRQDEQFDSEEN